MTTHLRALLLRSGAAAVLVTGALVGTTAAPAFAAAELTISANSPTLTVGGGAQSSTITVKNSGDAAPADTVEFSVDIEVGSQQIAMSTPPGCSATGTGFKCSIPANQLMPNDSKGFTATFTPPGQSSIPAGQQRDVNGQLKIQGGGSGSFKVTLKAAAATAPATQTVTEVSGTVNDSTTGKALKGATVTMEDGAGKSRSMNTNDAGVYRWLGTESNPIAPGGISISVTMNGYDAGSKNINVQAGKGSTGNRIALLPIGSTASPIAPPSMEETTPAGADSQSAAAPGAQNTTNTSSGGGSGLSSYILIALGALLVIFGIVAIVLLLRRRGDDDEEDLEEEPAPRRGGGGAAQRPGYRQAQADPTMVSAMGAPTMINRGSANDATAIVRPGRASDYDVPPDPYGAPLPRAGSGYGAAAAGAGYGAANGGGYNDQDGYAQGAPSAGYGPSSRPAVDPYSPEYGAGGGNGYNDQAGYGPSGGGGGGYADSTQRWEPSAGNGYAGGQGGGYGSGGANGANGANGYGADGGQNGYGPSSGGGYNGNGANGYGGDQGGYGQGGDQGGYGPGGGQGGYGPGGGQGGYGPSAGSGQGGYGPGGGGDGYPSAGGGYGPSAGNGYNGQADYDGPYAGRGGYEQRGGYEPAAGYERDGYERVPEPPRAGNDNYEQRGGYGDPQGAPRGGANGGNRRSLDWLDD